MIRSIIRESKYRRTGSTFVVAAVLTLTHSMAPADERVPAGQKLWLDTTPKTHVLFLDMLEVAGMDNVEQMVAQAEKHPANPVIPLGNVDQFDSRRASTWAGSLVYDEDDKLFKAWYYGCDPVHWAAIGYAESADGITWRKPLVNQFAYQGSTQNNICWCVGDGRTSHFEVNKDYNENKPDRRFQGVAYMPKDHPQVGDKSHYYALYSRDGKTWNRREAPLKWPVGDTGNFFFDPQESDLSRRVKMYGQHDAGSGPDIEHLDPAPANPVLTPGHGREKEIHFTFVIPYHGYYVMLYDLNLWQPYYGLMGNREKRMQQGRGVEGGTYIGDIRLAVSRDGLGKFQRIQPHQPVLPRGPRGTWDSGFLVLGGGAGILRGDEIYIFYTGVAEEGGLNFVGPVVPAAIQTGLAKLRLDGFTYLRNRDGITPGSMTTVPILVSEPQTARLIVNASHLIAYRDWIEVEVLDAGTGEPIEGCARSACDPILTDSVRTPVRWGPNQTLAGIKATSILLRFHLYGQARLYSFSFDVADDARLSNK